MKKQYFIFFLLLFFFTFFYQAAIINAEFNTDAGFGFGNQSFSEESSFGTEITFPDEREQAYFIHDTLIKFLFLLGFAISAIIIMIKKSSLRKLLLIFSIIILGFYLGGFLCPLTSVQNIVINIRTGYLLIFLIPTILALVFGRLFCGYICIFGGLQELLNLPKKYNLQFSDKTLKLLQKAKYFLLSYLLIRILITNSIIFAGNSPFNALFSWGGTPISIIITVSTIILSLFIYRPFCQFLCPLGAWLGLCAILSKYSIIPENCFSCNKCSQECSIKAIKKGKIDKKECILCNKCVDSCHLIAKKMRSCCFIDFHI